ncbi:GNAT family N-acetyltransferase [Roseinatronobacter ekhonensis]|uniref:GNAT family N-acetyltransferase n=1 Tax=Roseinatronobacter ekhonensis TaxID=254356 RepID=UPI0016047F26|nr:N-acetyltransferase [Roseibaca ekhonensis]
MRLRPARACDASCLAALSVEVWLTTYISRGLSKPFAEYVLDKFSPDSFACAIATDQLVLSEDDTGVTGYIRLKHGQSSPIAGCVGTELATLYIRPPLQGQGIGRALLSHAVSLAAGRSSPVLWLTVNCENQRAQGFYTAHGFSVAGRTQFVLDGQTYPNAVLRRDLS